MRVCHLVHGKAQLAGNGHSLMSKALFKSCNASVGQMTRSRRGVDKSTRCGVFRRSNAEHYTAARVFFKRRTVRCYAKFKTGMRFL